MSLRDLVLMATAKQRADWLRVGVAVAWQVNSGGFAKKPLSPLAVIPEPYRPPPEARRIKSAAERESESRQAWGVMDRFFSKVNR